MVDKIIYAKSNPKESLQEHTEKVLEKAKEVFEKHGSRIKENWPDPSSDPFLLLKIASIYHDLGKNYTPFQNKIRKSIGIEELNKSTNNLNVPHNLLSVAFFLADAESLNINEIELRTLIARVIAFHHHRDVMYELISPDNNLLKKVIKEDIIPNFNRLSSMKEKGAILNTPVYKGIKRILDSRWNSYWANIIRKKTSYSKAYILLCGLLMKADHAASANFPIEFNTFKNTKKLLTNYLNDKGIETPSIWQLKMNKDTKNSNVVLIASTGIGKTEFSIFWNGASKLFYTLPLRTSVNAMYERFSNVFNDSKRIGLLHSTASSYLLENISNKKYEISKQIDDLDKARQLSLPISISTADQIFTSVFKYPGYEKMYATLSYSNIVIDELQAYNPEIAAAILWGLKELTELGSRFCLMTATLPGFYMDFIKENLPDVVYKEQLMDTSKHKIKLLKESILDNIDLIIKRWKEKKRVLVVVNTVKRAQEIYQKLLEEIDEIQHNKLLLLHSGFILFERSEKERILLDKDKLFQGIAVCTQVVEASLDIDFPVLFTEIAPADSLIQRIGRVERKIREGYLDLRNENIYVFWNDETSGIGSVYNKELINGTGKILENFQTKNLTEKDKQNIVNKLYNSEYAKKVKAKFNKSINILKTGILKVSNRHEAQKLFRDISSINCIPYTVYEREEQKILKLVEILSYSKQRIVRLKSFSSLQKYILPIRCTRLTDSKIVKFIGNIAVVNIPYDSSFGIQYEKEESPFV